MQNSIRILVFVAILLLIWQYLLPYSDIPSYILPLPTEIWARFMETFWLQVANLAITAGTTLLGLGIGVVVGILLALLVVYVKSAKSIILPFLATFNGIPKIAIAPLLVIWFGLGPDSKIILAFLLSLFPIFVNSLTGLNEIDDDILDLAKLAGGSNWQMFTKVRLMHALPYITDALKVAFPLALVGSIVGEFIGGNMGIGYLVLSGQFNMDIALVFAALLSITIFTSLGIAAIGLFERLFLKWQPSRRER